MGVNAEIGRSAHRQRAAEGGPFDGRVIPLSPFAPAPSVRLRRRAETLLAGEALPRIEDLDQVLTDACAMVLMLETRHLRLQRAIAALGGVPGDETPDALRADELSQRALALRTEIAELQALTKRLSARRRDYERARPARPSGT